ncbi:MAG: hypothetical protein ACERKV_00435 [Clostridiaceae bacterium]
MKIIKIIKKNKVYCWLLLTFILLLSPPVIFIILQDINLLYKFIFIAFEVLISIYFSINVDNYYTKYLLKKDQMFQIINFSIIKNINTVKIFISIVLIFVYSTMSYEIVFLDNFIILQDKGLILFMAVLALFIKFNIVNNEVILGRSYILYRENLIELRDIKDIKLEKNKVKVYLKEEDKTVILLSSEIDNLYNCLKENIII